MPGTEYRPRLSVELTDIQAKKLAQYIPWGMQKYIFSAIIDDLISLLETGEPEKVIAVMVTGIIRPGELLKTLKQSAIKELTPEPKGGG